MRDLLTSPFLLAAIATGAMGLVLTLAAFPALFRLRILAFLLRGAFGVALLCIGLFLGGVALGTQGYRALIHEEVAARIDVKPLAAQRYVAHIRLADGRELTHELHGDEIYVDAHILKWKPAVNMLGLHTAYELDRIAGRYQSIDQERTAKRTIHQISVEKPIDVFRLRQRYPILEPLVDAQYGSGTYVPVSKPAKLEVRVTTSGLILRELP